jgi:uncharacterized protein YndB with AHSA1/START domain
MNSNLFTIERTYNAAVQKVWKDLDAKNFAKGWNHIIGTALKKSVE